MTTQLIKKILISCYLFAVSSITYAIPTDSTSLSALNMRPSTIHGFVLFTDTLVDVFCCQDKCDSAYPIACTFNASKKLLCPTNMTPKIAIAPISNREQGSCAIRGYKINLPLLSVKPTTNWYTIQFNKAYTNLLTCKNQPVTINYTIYCT
ncbi:MAG TPA: hypothetical protein VHZ76_01505 [Gammaproteobacteria bacterium]|nr:hypothetical protein [Gammaproteobacteria bacterium]